MNAAERERYDHSRKQLAEWKEVALVLHNDLECAECEIDRLRAYADRLLAALGWPAEPDYGQ